MSDKLKELSARYEILKRKYLVEKMQEEKLNSDEKKELLELEILDKKIKNERQRIKNNNKILLENNMKNRVKSKRKKIFAIILNLFLILITLNFTTNLMVEAIFYKSISEILLFTLATIALIVLNFKVLFSISNNDNEEKIVLSDTSEELEKLLAKSKEEEKKLANISRLQKINLEHFTDILKEKKYIEILMIDTLKENISKEPNDNWVDISLSNVRKRTK